ncbi:MAG: pilus assembly FimT family protein [Desulfobacteria bacterium]|nr:prepilin-type N-terminal cleavage/methylation domain-containing protein [Deltaproteobacteria bacterium]
MKDRRGFTLIEIMIALAIVGIVTIIATTNFSSWQSHYSGVGFQREFLSLCGEARTRSMSSSLQHRLLIDMNAGTVTLQRGDLGTASGTWVIAAPGVVGTRGAGINDVTCTPVVAVPTTFALVFNPDGEVLIQDNTSTSTATPLTQADVHLSAAAVADRATIRVFGWTSKARLANGWL